MYATYPNLDEIFYTAWNTNKLNTQCRQGLQVKLASGMSSEEQRIVNRLLHGVRRGWIQVVN